ncbi:helix-turn-helix domain-containing protein [Gordonia sp. VNK21]|uniref:helix-turn-helix domain-containing protein n=1 Tax=Gordonia sp. VNK21 TaxID=3382483 RepID=UPI0038D4B469
MSDREDGSAHRASASPPTSRVVAVLDLLVRRQGEPLGLSEIARSCSISKPTCLAVLTELTRHGYLRVDTHTKTYRLGAALVTAGRAAERDAALNPVVGERLRELSDRFSTMCVAAGRDGDQFMVLDVTVPDGMRPPVRPSDTFTFVLPTALMFVLWQGDEALRRWAAEHPSRSAAIEIEELRPMAEECRSTGYLVENLSPTLERVYRILATGSRDLSPDVRDLIADLLAGMPERRVHSRADLDESDPADLHRVGVIAAPTFDEDGEQSLLLVLSVLGDMTAAQIAERGAALRTVADELTTTLGGRLP